MVVAAGLAGGGAFYYAKESIAKAGRAQKARGFELDLISELTIPARGG